MTPQGRPIQSARTGPSADVMAEHKLDILAEYDAAPEGARGALDAARFDVFADVSGEVSRVIPSLWCRRNVARSVRRRRMSGSTPTGVGGVASV